MAPASLLNLGFDVLAASLDNSSLFAVLAVGQYFFLCCQHLVIFRV